MESLRAILRRDRDDLLAHEDLLRLQDSAVANQAAQLWRPDLAEAGRSVDNLFALLRGRALEQALDQARAIAQLDGRRGRLLEAFVLRRCGKRKEARRLLALVAVDEPFARYLDALCDIDDENEDAARQKLRPLFDAAVPLPQLRFILAGRELIADRLAEARGLFEATFAEDGGDGVALHLAAAAAAELGDSREARVLRKTAYRVTPALLAEDARDIEKALLGRLHARRIVQAKVKKLKVRDQGDLARLIRSLSWVGLRGDLNRVCRRNSLTNTAVVEEAAYAFWCFGEIEKAEGLMQQAVARAPERGDLLAMRAALLAALGKLKRGDIRKLLDDALARDPENHNALNARAVIASKDGNFVEAKAFYQRAMTARPCEATVHTNFMTLLKKHGQRAAAEVELREAWALSPFDAQVRLYYRNPESPPPSPWFLERRSWLEQIAEKYCS